MPTIAAIPLPSGYPFLAHVRKLEEGVHQHSKELEFAKGKAQEAKQELSMLKKDNDKLMDEIKFLQGQLKKAEKKCATNIKKLTKEKRQLSIKCRRPAKQAEGKTWGLAVEISLHRSALRQSQSKAVVRFCKSGQRNKIGNSCDNLELQPPTLASRRHSQSSQEANS